jgi:hypothetical protein
MSILATLAMAAATHAMTPSESRQWQEEKARQELAAATTAEYKALDARQAKAKQDAIDRQFAAPISDAELEAYYAKQKQLAATAAANEAMEAANFAMFGHAAQ